MSFADVLSNINTILAFVLTAFGQTITFINSNSILAIAVYIPLAFLLIYSVFSLISKLFNRKSDD